MNATDLAGEKRRRAAADIEAALHYLQLAGEALSRAVIAIPVPDLFADDVSSQDILSRSFLRAARSRVYSAQMHTRKAKETAR